MKKGAKQKSRLRRETPGPAATYGRSGPKPAYGDRIDVYLFRPARARRAGGQAHRQTFRAGARLSLGERNLLCPASDERDADF
jgi:hypothetical protein